MVGLFRLSARRGFTLVELLIALVLFSILSTTLMQIMLGGLDSMKRGRAMSRLRADMAMAMSMVKSDLECAKSLNGVMAPQPTSTSKSLELKFDRLVKGRDKNLRKKGGWDVWNSNQPGTVTVQYLIKDESLFRKEGDGASYVILDNVLLGDIPGVAPSGANYQSFFQWVRVRGQVNVASEGAVPQSVMEIRLKAGRYVGREVISMTLDGAVAVRNSNSEVEYIMPATGRNNTLVKAPPNTVTYGDVDLSVDPLSTVRNLRSGRLAF